MNATITKGMPFDAYRALPGMNCSTLKSGLRSMAHLRWAMDHPSEPSPQMDTGSAFHCLTTEPDSFAERFIVAQPCDRRTKAGKEHWEYLQQSGKTILTAEQHSNAVGMASAIRSVPLVADLLAGGGDIEVVIQWTDPATGVPCKCRLDYLLVRPTIIVALDLKSTSDASPRGFSGSVNKFGYGIQCAMYSEAVEIAFGMRPRFIFACAESSEPYLPAVYELTEQYQYWAWTKYKWLLARYRDCLACGEWPGYSPDIEPIELPRWAEWEE
jgi:hypothetical protein